MKQPSSRRRAFDAALADLNAVDLDLEAVVARMMDARPGTPKGQSFEPGGGGGDSAQERHVVTYGPSVRKGVVTQKQHPASAAIKEFDEAMRQLAKAAAVLRRHHRANTPHAPTGKQQAEVERANAGVTLCVHCTPWAKRLAIEPVHRTGDVNGNLPAPLALGRWCYEFVRANNRLPSEAEVRRHDEGLLVRVGA